RKRERREAELANSSQALDLARREEPANDPVLLRLEGDETVHRVAKDHRPSSNVTRVKKARCRADEAPISCVTGGASMLTWQDRRGTVWPRRRDHPRGFSP